MNWTDYVGESFQTDDGSVYIAESYDVQRGFCMRDRTQASNRRFEKESSIGSVYRMVIDCSPPKMKSSIRDEVDGWMLLDRAVLALEMEVSLEELITNFRSNGYSDQDIMLTIRGAELILKHRD